MQKSNKGFTLVELLVVIAIIGILASVVLVSLNSARGKARDARRMSDLHQLSLALENYYDAGLGRDGSGSGGTDTGQDYPSLTDAATSLGLLVSGGFIAALPKDPQTGSNYMYAGLGSADSCNGYHLGATLENSGNTALTSDADAVVGGVCTGSTDFAGADPIYDIKP